MLSDISAVITAGGRSSRFGHDKALARLAGRPLIAHVAASFNLFPTRFLVVDDDRYAFLGWPSVPDAAPGLGALSGLASALAHSHTLWVAFAAVDLPNLTPGYWQHLAAAREEDSQAVVALGPSGRPEPLAALYHTSCLAVVNVRLERRQLAMHALLADLTQVRLPWQEMRAQFGEQLFVNVNTTSELAALTGRDETGRDEAGRDQFHHNKPERNENE